MWVPSKDRLQSTKNQLMGVKMSRLFGRISITKPLIFSVTVMQHQINICRVSRNSNIKEIH